MGDKRTGPSGMWERSFTWGLAGSRGTAAATLPELAPDSSLNLLLISGPEGGQLRTGFLALCLPAVGDDVLSAAHPRSSVLLSPCPPHTSQECWSLHTGGPQWGRGRRYGRVSDTGLLGLILTDTAVGEPCLRRERVMVLTQL